METSAPSADLNLKLLRHLVQYLREYNSVREIESIAVRAGVPVADFLNSKGWVTLQQFERILADARALMQDDATFVEACAYKADLVNGPLRLVLPAVSPVAAYETGAKIMHLVTRISAFEARVLGRTRVRVLYRTTRPESRLMCLSRYAQIRSVPRLWGLPHAEVHDTSCVARGDACCTYEVRVSETARWVTTAITTAAFAAAGGVLEHVFPGSLRWYWLAFAGAVLGYTYELHRVARANRKSRKRMDESYADIATGEANAQRDLFRLLRHEQRAKPLAVPPDSAGEGSHVSLVERAAPNFPGESPQIARAAGSSGSTFVQHEFVADRYLIKRRIASGGMGEVYEAYDNWIGETVALKTIVPNIADDPQALARLKTEVRLARQVTHDNVCRVFDLGFWPRGGERIAFLTMELVRGVTLRQWLRENGPFDVEGARTIVKQMAVALSHAHASGVIHRDFKSDNVMLVGDPSSAAVRVVVMDFGLARSSLKAEGQPLAPNDETVVGTLDYMSPEQVQGLPAAEPSDIFSMGVVMFEMLAGRLPYDGDSPRARALRRLTEPAPELTRFVRELDPTWNRAVARCLQPEPTQRYGSLAELLLALELQDKNSSRPPAPGADRTGAPLGKQHAD